MKSNKRYQSFLAMFFTLLVMLPSIVSALDHHHEENYSFVSEEKEVRSYKEAAICVICQLNLTSNYSFDIPDQYDCTILLYAHKTELKCYNALALSSDFSSLNPLRGPPSVS